MTDTNPKPSPVKPVANTPGDFLENIARNRSGKRKDVHSAMKAVMGIYLTTQYDQMLEKEIDRLLDSITLELQPSDDGPRPKGAVRGGRVLIVTGAAGAGKSRSLLKAFQRRPEFPNFGVEGMPCPLISIVAPSPFTLKALGNEIVRKLGYHGRREIDEGVVWPMARLMLKELGIHIVHIDEAQHGDQISNPEVVQTVENTLKRLLQETDWPVWLILSGLPELAKFCQGDHSMFRRIHQVKFEPLRFDMHAETIKKTVRKIADLCPGITCKRLLTDEFVNRLLHASLHQFGIVVEFTQDAIWECLNSGHPTLTVDHFAEVYTSRTGETREDENVFKARDWTAIVVENALYEQPVDENGKPISARQLKKALAAKG